MADIIDMAGAKSKKAGEPNAELITFLTGLLDLAKDGQIQQVAAIWVAPDGVVGDGYSPGGHPDELYGIIGGLEVCKATLLDGIRAGEIGQPQAPVLAALVDQAVSRAMRKAIQAMPSGLGPLGI